MIHMPLIDESESLLDAELILALRDNFTTREYKNSHDKTRGEEPRQDKVG